MAMSADNQGGGMTKKFFIAWIVIFIGWMQGGWLVHGMMLHGEYAKLPQLFRPAAEARQYFPLMIIAYVLLSGALVWMYARGISASGWLVQGLRFGAAIDLLTIVPTYTIYYVVQPMPGSLVIGQIIGDGVLILLLSVITAFLYRPATS
jgi:hypothetical protein